jgi:hypothetical protein
MKNFCLLLIILTLVGCSKEDKVKPDMTTYLTGSYKLDVLTFLGEKKNYRWNIEKESGTTVQIRMTKVYSPFNGNPSTQIGYYDCWN